MKKTVMIIEDDALNMKLANDLLQAEGYLTVHSYDGVDAEQLVQVHKPNLILMDIRLPGRSGLQIVHSLKSYPAMRTIPIIALTSFSAHETCDVCREYGCDDYLSKPISIHHFRETIKKHLNNVSALIH